MPTLEWADLTWEELRALDRARCVALLPVGAVEAHGPHLPLDTDNIIAVAMARAGAARLEAAGRTPLLLPPRARTADRSAVRRSSASGWIDPSPHGRPRTSGHPS
ncbi:MAG TPA: creatininase family protein [Acidobacteriota bacterium]|nr:creatininase family protein [Acidobacteriota bacterium]